MDSLALPQPDALGSSPTFSVSMSLSFWASQSLSGSLWISQPLSMSLSHPPAAVVLFGPGSASTKSQFGEAAPAWKRWWYPDVYPPWFSPFAGLRQNTCSSHGPNVMVPWCPPFWYGVCVIHVASFKYIESLYLMNGWIWIVRIFRVEEILGRILAKINHSRCLYRNKYLLASTFSTHSLPQTWNHVVKLVLNLIY